MHGIDWCEVILNERDENWGLGRSILHGVTEVFKQHDALIVFEDDLISVPGTYRYLCAALEHYRDDPRVMSVTGYTHPSIRPDDVGDLPYFDGRFNSWSWGAWARSWDGMDRSALDLMHACQKQGHNPAHYGADLPLTARKAERLNVWAIRFVYLHILKSGLCLHPPHSLIENIGSGIMATNTSDLTAWSNLPLKPAPPIPDAWPEPIENPQCALLYQACYKDMRFIPRMIGKFKRAPRKIWSRVLVMNAKMIWQKAADISRYAAFKVLLTPYLTHNLPVQRLGSVYGGWSITPAGLNAELIVYSVGIGEDISFDLALMAQFNCRVFAFDPTPKSLEWLKRQELPEGFQSFAVGLADYDGQAEFFAPPNSEHVSHTVLRTVYQGASIEVEVSQLQTIMQRLGHTHIDLLKLDIEGAEYAVIADIIASGLKPRQFLIEFHDRFPGSGGILQTIRSVRQLHQYGYKLFAVSKPFTEFSFIFTGD